MDQSPPENQNPYASPGWNSDLLSSNRAVNKPGEPLVRPIRISGSLSWDEYLTGIKLWGQGRPQLFNSCLSMLFLVIIIWGFMAGFFFENRRLVTAGAVATCIYFVISGILKFIAKFARGPFQELYNQRLGIFEHTTTIFSEEGIERQSESESNKSLWSEYQYYYNLKSVIVLKDNNAIAYHFFPRSHFQTIDDWDCLLELLKKKLPWESIHHGTSNGTELPSETSNDDFIPTAPAVIESFAALRNSLNPPISAPIIVEGAITRKDLSLAQKMAIRTHMPMKRYFILAAEISFFLFLALFWAGFLIYGISEIFIAFTIFSLSILFVLFAFLGLLLHSKRKLKDMEKNGRGVFSQSKTFILEDRYIDYESNSFWEVKWRAFSDFESSDELILIYYHGFGRMRIFAKHLFRTREDWDCLISLLDRKLPRR